MFKEILEAKNFLELVKLFVSEYPTATIILVFIIVVPFVTTQILVKTGVVKTELRTLISDLIVKVSELAKDSDKNYKYTINLLEEIHDTRGNNLQKDRVDDLSKLAISSIVRNLMDEVSNVYMHYLEDSDKKIASRLREKFTSYITTIDKLIFKFPNVSASLASTEDKLRVFEENDIYNKIAKILKTEADPLKNLKECQELLLETCDVKWYYS